MKTKGRNNVKLYNVTRPDGRVVKVSVPDRECSDCGLDENDCTCPGNKNGNPAPKKGK